MPTVLRIRESRRHPELHGSERFEICEVVPTVHGERVVNVLATATTVPGARLAVRTIHGESGIDTNRIRIYDTLRHCWLGPRRLERKEEL